MSETARTLTLRVTEGPLDRPALKCEVLADGKPIGYLPIAEATWHRAAHHQGDLTIRVRSERVEANQAAPRRVRALWTE